MRFNISTPTVSNPTDEKIIQRISAYWSNRASEFGRVREFELESDKTELWWQEIKSHLPSKTSKLKFLDVGTGTGFFSILLSTHGYEVTGIDVSNKMLAEASRIAKQRGHSIEFIIMEASDLKFDNEIFDCVLCRNVTWTLPHPEQAYCEWHRVLKPGGTLINFDANYGAINFIDLKKYDGHHSHNEISDDLLLEGEELRKMVPLTYSSRPQWDINLLNHIGFINCFCDINISSRVYKTKDVTFNPVPMFVVGGYKN